MKLIRRNLALILVLTFLFNGYGRIWANADVFTSPHSSIQSLQDYETYIMQGNNTVYNGNLTYAKVIADYDYPDVKGMDKVHTTKLSMLEIAEGLKNKSFGANQNLTNIQALVLLLKASGADDEIMENLRNKFPNTADSKLMNMYDKEAFQVAKTRGILTEAENFDLYAGANQESVLNWTMKAFAIPNVSAEIDNKVLLNNQLSNLFSKNAITKVKFARFISEVIDAYPNGITLTKNRGYVVGIEKGTDAGGKFTDIHLQNSSAQIEKIRLKQIGNQHTDFVVIENGRLFKSDLLKIGDELELTLKDAEILYAVKLPANVVKQEIVNTLGAMEGVEITQGNITGKIDESIDVKDEKKKITKLTVSLINNNLVGINFETDLKRNIVHKPLISSYGKFLGEDALKVNDKITLFVKDNAILYIMMGAEPAQDISGNIKQIVFNEERTAAKITIFGFDDRLYTFDIDDKSTIVLNYYRAQMSDILEGTTADVKAIRGKVLVLKMSSYYPSQGYIPPRSRVEFGTVREINGNRVTLVEKNNVAGSDKQEYRFFEVDKLTKFFKGSTKIKYGLLKKGDKVKLYFDDIYTNYPSRVEIEGKNQEINRILKGKIENYNQFNNVISVSNLYELKNAFWNKQYDIYQQDFKISIGSEIYERNELYPHKLINKEIVGREVYFVTKNNFGSNEIVKMVMKEGSERNYVETLAKHNPIDKLVTLKDRRNLNYGDGTIFVENNMLVTESAIRKDASVILIGNLSEVYDDLKIAVIQEEQADYFKDFYIASLERVDPYRVTLSNYGYARGYHFTNFDRGEVEFRISDETLILDMTHNKQITPEELFHGKYSKEENYEKHSSKLKYKRYYVMAIVEDGEIKSMVLRKKGIFPNYLIDDRISKEYLIPDELKKSLGLLYYTQGVVESKNDKWSRLTLKDSYNYQAALKEWKPNKANTSIEFATTIVLKNGKLIDYSDIKVGDKLYVMRSGYKAVYVIVK